MKYAKASRTQIIAIHQRLVQVLEKVGEDHCKYIEPSSDHSVAQELNCSPNNVAGVRKELFGNLFKKSVPSDELLELRSQVNALQNKLGEVDGRLQDLEIKHNKLCETLSLNRLASVNHLTVMTTKRTA